MVQSLACARDVVARYYALIDAGDVDGVTALVGEFFGAECFVHRPESLRGGGRLSGRDRVLRFSRSAAAHSGGPGVMRLGHIFEEVEEPDAVQVVVELHFHNGTTWTRALEWWSFRGGEAVSIQAFYWDVAALAGPA
jgi:ketosteroid isomerase-like protein